MITRMCSRSADILSLLLDANEREAHCLLLVFTMYLTLASWSWTTGFVLGSASRDIVRFNAVLFCLMLLFGEILGVPLYLAYQWQYLHRGSNLPAVPNFNSPVFALTFYRLMFPFIVQALLAIVPSVWGISHGAGATKLKPALRTTFRVVAIVTLMAILFQNPASWLLLKLPKVPLSLQSWASRLPEILVYWPLVYLTANAIVGYQHDKVPDDLVQNR